MLVTDWKRVYAAVDGKTAWSLNLTIMGGKLAETMDTFLRICKMCKH